MIEEIVLQCLLTVFDHVYTEEQEKPDEEYIVIEKTAGSEENHLHNATLAIKSYSSSMYKAALLNERVKSAMKKMDEIVNISKVNLNSDYNYTDTAKKKYRYQAVYDIYYFKEEE